MQYNRGYKGVFSDIHKMLGNRQMAELENGKKLRKSLYNALNDYAYVIHFLFVPFGLFRVVYFRQHRTKTIFCILYASCLHIFRHIAQFVLARRQPCCVLIVQSDEKSDCAIRAQSLCGIALIYMYGLTPVMTVT